MAINITDEVLEVVTTLAENLEVSHTDAAELLIEFGAMAMIAAAKFPYGRKRVFRYLCKEINEHRELKQTANYLNDNYKIEP